MFNFRFGNRSEHWGDVVAPIALQDCPGVGRTERLRSCLDVLLNRVDVGDQRRMTCFALGLPCIVHLSHPLVREAEM
jgi:hypothetical protein